MKRHIYRNLLIIAAFFAATACSEKEISDQEILDGRESVQLDVFYARGETPVGELYFSHSAGREILWVNVNNENLKWNLESDRPWCTVFPEEHRGSGIVTLDIALNETFEAREPATLTFVAGEYRGFRIQVHQSASAFILSQPYFTAPKSGAPACSVKVTTPAGADWSYTPDNWLQVEKGSSTTKDGFVTTELTITPADNGAASRFGSVALKSNGENENIWFYQFGNDLDYDAEGHILFPGEGEASLSFLAPAFIVKDIVLPAFATSSITENGDGTATVTITLEKNLSDCAETREVLLALKLANASASVVTLPAMVQDYIPANGLVTAKGLIAFAQAVAEGKPTTDWEDQGVVKVKQDIDMAGISDWPGIGTTAKPFTGKFDGGGHAVTNLKGASVGLFGATKGATIQDITLGKGCSLYNNKEYVGKGGSFGGIVSYAEGTTLTGCGLSGDIEYAGESDDDSPSVVGGIVGYADETSTITRAKMAGKIVISMPASGDAACYVGGIAGYCNGALTASEITGKINISSSVNTLIAGGILGCLPEGATVANNSFMGTMTLGGSCPNVLFGGLYGEIASDRVFDSASDKSVSLGTINLDSYQGGTNTQVFAGGFAGKADKGISLTLRNYEFQTNIALDLKANRPASYICIGGVLGGCDPASPVTSVSFEGVGNLGTFSVAYDTNVTPQISRAFVGGVAGFTHGPASFKSCTNNGEIGYLTDGLNSANTKHYLFVYGGIAGVAIGGDTAFEGCENKGLIMVKHYSNSIPENTREDWYSACIAAGILGAFDYKPLSEGGKLTMSDCTNAAYIGAYRGMAAGIVGFARNATITGCNNFGDLGQNSGNNSNAANKGGIACWLTASSISNCIAKCNVFTSNPASAVQSSGGILSLATGGGVSVTGCSYFGILSVNKGDQPLACGGIVSTAEEDTVVKDCKYGGRVNGIDISENNVASYAIGNGIGSATGIALWNGNI